MESKNRIGMFDLFKGVGMLIIMYAHCELVEATIVIDQNSLRSMPLILFWVLSHSTLMPSFFIMSGYGFRAKNNQKCFSQQAQLMLKPYCITGIFTTLFVFVAHFLSFRYLPDALKESTRTAISFLLGMARPQEVLGYRMSTCGPLWYILALFWGWCILNFCMNRFAKTQIPVILLLIATAGWLIGCGPAIPFCITQGMIAVVFLYAGHRLKKEKILTKKIPAIAWFGVFCAAFLDVAIMFVFHNVDEMASSIWVMGTISIILDTILGVAVLHCFMRLNRFDNVILSGIRWIGFHSMLVFCVHTVEMIAIPWYLFTERFTNTPLLGCVVQFFIRLVLDISVCIVITNRRSWFDAIKERFIKEKNGTL